jgi:hypothetical protein
MALACPFVGFFKQLSFIPVVRASSLIQQSVEELFPVRDS